MTMLPREISTSLDAIRIRPRFARAVVGQARCAAGGKWTDDEGDLAISLDADGFIEWDDALALSDAQNLAMAIVDPLGKGLEDHWSKTSCALTAGLVLHAIYMWQAGRSEHPPSLHGLDQILSEQYLGSSDLWSEMILGGGNQTDQVAGYYRGVGHPTAVSAGQDMMDRPHDECLAIVATARSHLMGRSHRASSRHD